MRFSHLLNASLFSLALAEVQTSTLSKGKIQAALNDTHITINVTVGVDNWLPQSENKIDWRFTELRITPEENTTWIPYSPSVQLNGQLNEGDFSLYSGLIEFVDTEVQANVVESGPLGLKQSDDLVVWVKNELFADDSSKIYFSVVAQFKKFQDDQIVNGDIYLLNYGTVLVDKNGVSYIDGTFDANAVESGSDSSKSSESSTTSSTPATSSSSESSISATSSSEKTSSSPSSSNASSSSSSSSSTASSSSSGLANALFVDRFASLLLTAFSAAFMM